MIMLIVSLVLVFISLLFVIVFLFFNKEKSKHELVLQNIQQNIKEQKQTLLEQNSQLTMLQNSAKVTENSMEKVVDSFNDIPVSDNPFLVQHLENLDAFSKNSLHLIQIYGGFVKGLS